MKPAQIKDVLRHLTPDEAREFEDLLAADFGEVVWRPLPGPQTMAAESPAAVIGFGGAAGGGKGIALTTALPTPSGWVSMGDVKVGDTLFDEQGQACTVTAVSDVCTRQCFRLTFDDGATLVADDVHRWVTFTAKELAAPAARNATLPPPGAAVRDTSQLHATLRENHAIAQHAALALPPAALPVPPYTLGVWLGDGTSRNGLLAEEDYVWERMASEGFDVRHNALDEDAHGVVGLKAALRDCGVLHNKHIPLAYLRASYSQRLALVQGLMDTSGHVAVDGGCAFDNTSEQLAHDVLHLVRTLGIKASLRRETPSPHGREAGAMWRVAFVTSSPVVGLPRKAQRLRPHTRSTAQFRHLVACDRVPSVPTRCIAVDSPSRQYLAGHAMVPTHNTDLAIGLALTEHRRVQFFRREGPQLKGVLDRVAELAGRSKLGGNPPVYRDEQADRQIEFNSMPNAGDETKYQGRAKDLLVIDEAANFLESQVRFVKGWVRVSRNQRTRTLLTFNPPTTSDGRWVIDFFGPWLNKRHSLYPSQPGQLRYVYVDPATGKDTWLMDDDPRPFVLVNGKRVYDFDPSAYQPEDIVTPESRTFIPSRVSDNPYLTSTGYIQQLQALPEPLRSQMLYGDFDAGVMDDQWQVIPTAWVEAAMARWKPRDPKGEMMSIGVDVARGGQDNTVIAFRHADRQAGHAKWFDKLLVEPGKATPDGNAVAGLVVAHRRDRAPIHIDVIGVGASPYDTLKSIGQEVYGINVSTSATRTDRSGRLQFFNLRSQLWWQLREDLDPANATGIALPPDNDLLRELTAPRWSLSGATLKVESREDIVERLGYSPDRATAVILANMDTPKIHVLREATQRAHPLLFDPVQREFLESNSVRNPLDYDPMC